jgi:predicted lipoprotein with Yx(FWY)xxD motif
VNRSGHAVKRSIFRRLAFIAAVSIVGVVGIATAWASGTTEVKVVKARGQRIVGQQKGYTLYAYCTFGSAGEVCKAGHSARMWPPMIAYHTPVAGPGINAKKLGTKKINGKKIVTYYGQPLYRYNGDKKPGQTNGEAKGNHWFVLTQFGQPQPKNGY